MDDQTPDIDRSRENEDSLGCLGQEQTRSRNFWTSTPSVRVPLCLDKTDRRLDVSFDPIFESSFHRLWNFHNTITESTDTDENRINRIDRVGIQMEIEWIHYKCLFISNMLLWKKKKKEVKIGFHVSPHSESNFPWIDLVVILISHYLTDIQCITRYKCTDKLVTSSYLQYTIQFWNPRNGFVSVNK